VNQLASPAPASPASAVRQAFPDRLRGLALLGIVVVNAPFLGISASGFTGASTATPWDWWAAFAVAALAQGKFYLLFAFLFGYSAAFILKDGGPAHRRVYRRRLGGLALIGLLHASLFFVGDILLSYAALGLALPLLLTRSDRVVTGAAVVTGALATLWLALLAWAASGLGAAEPMAEMVRLDEALAGGSFTSVVWARLAALPTVLVTLATLNWGYTLCAFCLGLLAARKRFLADPAARAGLWRRFVAVGIGLGLPLQCLAAYWAVGDLNAGGMGGTATGLAGIALGFATAPVLALGYLGAMGMALVRWPGAFGWAEAAGRMSLTLYVGESVLLSWLFGGHGLGLYGQWGAAAVTALAVLVWLGLELAARAWLARRQQGPLEALLGAWSRRADTPA
jgi:uncharacterized protein